MGGIWLRDVLRHVRRNPLTTTINVLTLTLGLACFLGAWAASAYWRSSDQHFANADRIEVLTQALQNGDVDAGAQSWTASPLGPYLAEDFPDLEAVARLGGSRRWQVSNAADIRASLVGYWADPAFFDIFDFPFLYGQRETALDAPGSVVLTADASRRLFGDADPVGETVRFNNRDEYVVTGVLAPIKSPSHLGDQRSSLRWFKLIHSRPALVDEGPEQWRNADMTTTTYAMLPAEDVSRRRAEFRATLRDYPSRRVPEDQREGLAFGAIGLEQLQVRALDGGLFGGRSSVLSVPTFLYGLGVLVLAISCVNYTNLATAQALRRTREIAMSRVVGARGRDVLVNAWLDAMAPTVLAAVLAIALLVLAAPMVLERTQVDLLIGLSKHGELLLFLGALLPVVGLVASAYPVAVLTRIRPADALRGGRSRSTAAPILAELLVGLQFFFASALLIMLIVVGQQNGFLQRQVHASGDDPIAIMTDYASRGAARRGLLEQRLADHPAIEAIGLVAGRPWGEYGASIPVSRSDAADATPVPTLRHGLGHSAFEVLGAKLIAGRLYQSERDPRFFDEAASENPAVIDRKLATALGFSSPSAAVDQLIFAGDRDQSGELAMRVIGVVETLPLVISLRGAQGNLYALPFEDEGVYPLIRFHHDRAATGVEAIEQTIRQLDPNATPQLYFIDEEFNQEFTQYTAIQSTVAIISTTAFVIAGLGLFAMAAFAAARRRHEVGVRKTLGASSVRVVGLLLRDFSRPVLIANLAAWPIAYLIAEAYLKSFMQRVDLTPAPWVAGLVATVLIAWAVVGGQALYAARTRPADVLRFE